MKHSPFAWIVSSILLVACSGGARQNNSSTTPLPPAMEDKSSYSLKRSYADPVSSIYDNILEENPALQKMEQEVDRLDGEKSDSAEAVTEYLNRVAAYYRSAESHIGSIKDSILRHQMIAILHLGKSNSDNRSKDLRQWMDTVNQNMQNIDDRREAVKVLLTLPVIQQYEQKNKPSPNPLIRFNQTLEKRKATLDSIIRKSGG